MKIKEKGVEFLCFTNEVCGKSPIAKPSCWAAVKEVFAIGRKVAFHSGVKGIVVP